MIKEEWAPKSFLITFKLETDELKLIEKARNNIIRSNCHYVVANTLKDRYEKVLILSSYEKFEIFKAGNDHIEEFIVKMIVTLHQDYIDIIKQNN
jgi:phosphopantothenate-cysteine ligase